MTDHRNEASIRTRSVLFSLNAHWFTRAFGAASAGQAASHQAGLLIATDFFQHRVAASDVHSSCWLYFRLVHPLPLSPVLSLRRAVVI